MNIKALHSSQFQRMMLQRIISKGVLMMISEMSEYVVVTFINQSQIASFISYDWKRSEKSEEERMIGIERRGEE
jgi:hypothetical protein